MERQARKNQLLAISRGAGSNQSLLLAQT